jgi:hypothetical protein
MFSTKPRKRGKKRMEMLSSPLGGICKTNYDGVLAGISPLEALLIP